MQGGVCCVHVCHNFNIQLATGRTNSSAVLVPPTRFSRLPTSSWAARSSASNVKIKSISVFYLDYEKLSMRTHEVEQFLRYLLGLRIIASDGRRGVESLSSERKRERKKKEKRKKERMNKVRSASAATTTVNCCPSCSLAGHA